MALLCVISATNYAVVSETRSNVEKEIRKSSIVVKKLHKVVTKIYGNLPVFTITPELILSMDNTMKCSRCEAIYISNNQQTFKKGMDGNFYNILRLLKNRKKSDSFASHFEQHFNTTTSRTDLRKYMSFKVVNQLKLIGAMKTFTKPNFNLCMEERLTILKRVTIMNNNLDIYGACRHKTTFHQFFLSTDDPVFNR